MKWCQAGKISKVKHTHGVKHKQFLINIVKYFGKFHEKIKYLFIIYFFKFSININGVLFNLSLPSHDALILDWDVPFATKFDNLINLCVDF